jgi:hypothetical protein
MFVVLGVGLLALVKLIAIPLVVIIVLTLRRARSLDAIFTPLGLTGHSLECKLGGAWRGYCLERPRSRWSSWETARCK